MLVMFKFVSYATRAACFHSSTQHHGIAILHSFMHSLYLCTTCIHIGSEEEVPVEYVIVEEENPQELPPEGEGQVSEPLPECPNPPLFAEASPGHFTFPPISILNYT